MEPPKLLERAYLLGLPQRILPYPQLPNQDSWTLRLINCNTWSPNTKRSSDHASPIKNRAVPPPHDISCILIIFHVFYFNYRIKLYFAPNHCSPTKFVAPLMGFFQLEDDYKPNSTAGIFPTRSSLFTRPADGILTTQRWQRKRQPTGSF